MPTYSLVICYKATNLRDLGFKIGLARVDLVDLGQTWDNLRFQSAASDMKDKILAQYKELGMLYRHMLYRHNMFEDCVLFVGSVYSISIAANPESCLEMANKC